MAAPLGGKSAGLISGVSLGGLFGVLFPPFVGPLVGILVGSSMLQTRDLRAGAGSGLVMGAGAGLLVGLHTVFSSGGPLPGMDILANSLLCSITLYAGFGLAVGLAGSWLRRVMTHSSGMFW